MKVNTRKNLTKFLQKIEGGYIPTIEEANTAFRFINHREEQKHEEILRLMSENKKKLFIKKLEKKQAKGEQIEKKLQKEIDKIHEDNLRLRRAIQDRPVRLETPKPKKKEKKKKVETILS